MISGVEAKRKSQCFKSSWWVIDREPDVVTESGEILEPGRAKRYALLSAPEMAKLGAFGRVHLRGLDVTVRIG
jgi:hypothetical protein